MDKVDDFYDFLKTASPDLIGDVSKEEFRSTLKSEKDVADFYDFLAKAKPDLIGDVNKQEFVNSLPIAFTAVEKPAKKTGFFSKMQEGATSFLSGVEEGAAPFLSDVYHSFERGSTTLGSMLARTPGYLADAIYTVAAIPQNLAANIPGLEDLKTSPEKFREMLGQSGDNAIAEYYDDVTKQLQESQKEKFDKGLTEYLSDGEYGKFSRSLANQVAESLPITLGIIAGTAAGISPAAITLGGGAVFGAGQRADDRKDPNNKLSEEQLLINSFSKGAVEGLFESAFGVGRAAGIMAKDALEREGAVAAKEFTEETFKNIYKDIFKKHLGIGGEELVTEAATQFAQNAIDKYSGNKPDMDIWENVADAGIVGLGSSGLFSGVTAPHEIAASKSKRDKLQELEVQKRRLEEDLRIPAPDGVKSAILTERDKLNDESNTLAAKARDEIKNLPEDEQKQVLDLRNERNDIENTLNGETPLSDDAKNVLRDRSQKIDEKIDGILKENKKKPAAETTESLQQERLDIENKLNEKGLRQTEKIDLLQRLDEIDEGLTQPQKPEAKTAEIPFIEDFKLQDKEVELQVINADTGKKEAVTMNALEAQNNIKKELDRYKLLKDCLLK